MTQVISLVGDTKGAPILSEAPAVAAGILPGHLVEQVAAGVQVHGTAAGTAVEKTFAQTNKATAGDIDTAYANGETVSFGAYHAGQEVYALVAAGATAITAHTALESAGDGTLRNVSTGQAVAFSLEAVDNSGGGSPVRIKVRIA